MNILGITLTGGEIAALLTALAALVWGGFNAISNRNVSVATAWEKLNIPLVKRIDDLERENGNLRLELSKVQLAWANEVKDLRIQINERDTRIITLQSDSQKQSARITRLEGQLASMGANPVP